MHETCTYTTVFHSKASHYYAVAPRNPYEKLLSDALRSDVVAMVAGNGDGAFYNADALPCEIWADQRSNSTGVVPPLLSWRGAATAASSIPPPYVCVESVVITDVRKHLQGIPQLLGVTFQVNISWETALANTRTAPAGTATKGDKSARASVIAHNTAVAADADLRRDGAGRFTRETCDDGAAAVQSEAGDSAATWCAGARRAREMNSSAVGRRWTRYLAGVPEALGTNRSSVVELSDPSPATPFVWTLPKGDAFPSVRQNLLKVLTRQEYLSAYQSDLHVFGRVTLSDLSAMLSMRVLSSSSKPLKAQARAASRAVDRVNVTLGVPGTPVAGTAQRQARQTPGKPAASKRGGVDYCRILFMPASSTYSPPRSTSLSMVMTADGEASYPIELVQVAQGAYSSVSAKCANLTCITGAVCSLVMMILIACAALAYVHQLWRRRIEERADERRLRQHDLR